MADSRGIAVKLSNGDTRHIADVFTTSKALLKIRSSTWLRTDEETLIAASHIVEVGGAG